MSLAIFSGGILRYLFGVLLEPLNTILTNPFLTMRPNAVEIVAFGVDVFILTPRSCKIAKMAGTVNSRVPCSLTAFAIC